MSGPVCLCCSSRETTNLYLLDIKNKDMVLLDAKVRILQGSYGHEKSWNLQIYFPGLEKSWVLGKIAKVMEFHFLVKIFLSV